MPIQFSSPPTEVLTAVTNRIRDVAAAPESNARGLGGSAPAELTPSMPHDVYVIGLYDVIAGRPPDSASLTGWRFIMYSKDGAVASAETQIASNGQHRFALFNSGPFVAATVETVNRMNNVLRMAEKNPRLSLLRIPALHVTALWLHDDNEDTYTPLAPAPEGLDPNRQYSSTELFDVLRPEAQSQASIGVGDETGG